MNARKRLLRMQKSSPAAVLFPLPEGKPETRNCFGTMKRWNTATGKYDLKA